MSGTAVVLPGRRHGHAQSGLRLVELALAHSGLELVRVDWPADGMPTRVADAATAETLVALTRAVTGGLLWPKRGVGRRSGACPGVATARELDATDR